MQIVHAISIYASAIWMGIARWNNRNWCVLYKVEKPQFVLVIRIIYNLSKDLKIAFKLKNLHLDDPVN